MEGIEKKTFLLLMVISGLQVGISDYNALPSKGMDIRMSSDLAVMFTGLVGRWIRRTIIRHKTGGDSYVETNKEN